MKRFISCLLVAVLLISCMATMAFAAAPGDTIDVTFSVSNNTGFACFDAEITYDASALELVSITEGITVGTGFWYGKAESAMVAYSQAENFTGNGVLFTATFKVKDSAAVGTYTVGCVVTGNTASSNDEMTIPVSVGNGTVTISCTEHAWDEGVKTDATCTEAGKIVYTCTKCGETKEETVAAKGHAYGDWTVTKAPTCTEKGEETRICANDATHVETREVAAAGHRWTQWTKGDDGKLHRECTVCGAKETQNDGGVVPGGDITPVLTMGAVAMISMLAAVAFVFKRKFAK